MVRVVVSSRDGVRGLRQAAASPGRIVPERSRNLESPPPPARNNPLLGIGLKVLSVGVFLAMSSFLKAAEGIPAGELVFFRSFFAILPIVLFLAWRRELRAGVTTSRPGGHVLRGVIGVCGQGLGFYALTQLPLAEAVAINYATPLLVVMASAVFLHEKVRLYRWSAVIFGLVGVGIIIWPRLVPSAGAEAVAGASNGALAALAACCFATIALMQVRRLVVTERSSTIVFYYSIACSSVALLVLPFGWVTPSPQQAVFLVCAGICGGIGQVTLTESFRHADMSVVAPFEYASLIFSIIVGFVVFHDVPTVEMIVGSLILVAAGIFIIFREQRLGVAKPKAGAVAPPAA